MYVYVCVGGWRVLVQKMMKCLRVIEYGERENLNMKHASGSIRQWIMRYKLYCRSAIFRVRKYIKDEEATGDLMKEVFELHTKRQGIRRWARKGGKDEVNPSNWSEKTSELLWSDEQSELWTTVKG